MAVPRHLLNAGKTYLAHQMTDRAASLTYFAMMSLFPALLLIVSTTVILGDPSLSKKAAKYLLDNGADKDTASTVRSVLDSMLRTSSGAAGITFVVSLILGLNGASAAFGAAGRALNVIHHVDDDRSFVHRKASSIGWTAVVVGLLIVTLVSMVLGGRVADDIFDDTLGLGSGAGTVWSYVRWPIALAAVHVAFEIVYAYAPDVEPRRFRWYTAGSLLAVGGWLLASVGLNLYVAHFGSYGAAYGTFGAAIVLLLWIFVSANAFLFGAELDKTIERARALDTPGAPRRRRPVVAPSPPAATSTTSPAPDSPGRSARPGGR